MVIWHKERGKKFTGSTYEKSRDKRKCELGRAPAMTKADKENLVRDVRCRGANIKHRALKVNYANVLDLSTKKMHKAEIKHVVDNPSSRHFARMKVITKGAIIDTSVGKAKVTNRPGQEGFINAVKL